MICRDVPSHTRRLSVVAPLVFFFSIAAAIADDSPRPSPAPLRIQLQTPDPSLLTGTLQATGRGSLLVREWGSRLEVCRIDAPQEVALPIGSYVVYTRDTDGTLHLVKTIALEAGVPVTVEVAPAKATGRLNVIARLNGDTLQKGTVTISTSEGVAATGRLGQDLVVPSKTALTVKVTHTGWFRWREQLHVTGVEVTRNETREVDAGSFHTGTLKVVCRGSDERELSEGRFVVICDQRGRSSGLGLQKVPHLPVSTGQLFAATELSGDRHWRVARYQIRAGQEEQIEVPFSELEPSPGQDQHGSIHSWLAAGPIADHLKLPGTQQPAEGESVAGTSPDTRWQRLDTDRRSLVVKRGRKGAVLRACYVHADAPTDLRLWVYAALPKTRDPGNMRGWIGNRALTAPTRWRHTGRNYPYGDRTDGGAVCWALSLNPGWNRLLLAFEGRTGDRIRAVRLADAFGNPIPNLRIRLAPGFEPGTNDGE